MAPELRRMSFKGQKEALDLPTLEERMIRESVITYKFLDHDDVKMGQCLNSNQKGPKTQRP